MRTLIGRNSSFQLLQVNLLMTEMKSKEVTHMIVDGYKKSIV